MADNRNQQQGDMRRQGARQSQQSQSQQGQPQQSQPQQGQNQGRQQQQFDSGTRQPGGSGGGEARFADQIRPHMQVVDGNDQSVGTVDHIDGDRIKLTREGGEHHYLMLSQVAGIEGDRVRLRDRGDTTFGMEAGN